MKKIGWRSPSNIAFVKYWGKGPGQIPCNASISMTLNAAYTDTVIELHEKHRNDIEVSYFFEGKINPDFERKILVYLEQTKDFYPVLREHALTIRSENSFPHSTGIASSASAFGALALGLLSASGYEEGDFNQRASFLARLGSGSACRSIYGGYNLWGKLDGQSNPSDEYAVPLTEIHPDFQQMNDAILIVDDTPKKVSSSAGHHLMKDHWYAKNRFAQADFHAKEMIKILKTGDFQQFSSVIEQEALALHAMMMTSAEAYMLLKPGTIRAIEEVRKLRNEYKLKICFTLDAGPNVHVIYPKDDEKQIVSYLEDHLRSQVKEIIYDSMGNGPKQLMIEDN